MSSSSSSATTSTPTSTLSSTFAMTIIHSQQYVLQQSASASSSRARQPTTARRSPSSYHNRSPSACSNTSPRFSHIFSTVLGSPFLTTTDTELGLGPDADLDLVDGTAHVVPRNQTITRPSSPAPTADFSIIDVDPDDDDARYPYRYAYQGYHGGRSGGHGRSASSLGVFGRRGTYPLPNSLLGVGNGTTPLKSIFPRLWDALSSPGRVPSPPSTPSPPFRYNTYGKGKAPSFDYQLPAPASYIDYSDLPPLDGEEGELIAIDDEACFINVTAVTGIDILALLPPELALHILILLCTPSSSPVLLTLNTATSTPSSPNPTYYPRHSIASSHRQIPQEHESAQTALATLIACCSVSRTWRTLARDNTVWRALFLARWGVDLRRAGRGTRERHATLLREQGELGSEKMLPVPSIRMMSSLMTTPTKRNENLSPNSSPSSNLSASIRMRMAMKKRRMKDIFSSSSSTPASSTSSPSHSNPFLSLPSTPVQTRSRSLFPTPLSTPVTLPSTPSITARSSMPVSPHRGPGNNRRAFTTPEIITTSPEGNEESKSRAKRSFSFSSSPSTHSMGRPVSATPTIPVTHAPLKLDWRVLYRERMELEKRWNGIARAVPALEGSVSVGPGVGGGRADVSAVDGPGAVAGGRLSQSGTGDAWEPRVMRISGHNDSVYCLEFDSTRIITGSRDRTIKVWSLKTGRLLGTFWGVHRGSVLCLKFEGDWEREWEDDEDEHESEYEDGHRSSDSDDAGVMVEKKQRKRETKPGRETERKGFMVSGSSDCSVCVWDLTTGPIVGDGSSADSSNGPEGDTCTGGSTTWVGDEPEREVKAEVRAVLKGHVGGVLDLRIDRRWIVSCSKDAVIRVWDRITLDLHRTLRGHEGPVNAVGLQSEKVVSASGDGKMILWDIESGERLRTFEGHDRGLACIEFKDDLIVSGSNDCKIKVWSASTGECLRTLVGHEALVRALSFDPRSGRLVSASYDKTVKLWDLGSGKMIREFKNIHTSHIFDVRFDVGRIVSTSHDQKIVVLDFAHGLDASLFI